MKKHFLDGVALAILMVGIVRPVYADDVGNQSTIQAEDDTNDDSDPVLERKDPEWFNNAISAIHPPDNLSDEVQLDCTMKILEYVNNTFHTEFGIENVVPIQLPGWEKPEAGFIRGGGFNIRVAGNQLIADNHPVKYGRFMPLIGWFELGAHAALHLPGSIGGYQTFTWKQILNTNSPDLTENPDSKDSTEVSTEYRQVDFVAHIDTADPYEPLGAIIHLFRDVIGASGRNPCPGTE